MRRTLMLTTLLALATTAARAQSAATDPVYLRLGGVPGQSNHYQTTVDVFMRGPMASSDSTVPAMRSTRFMTRTVDAISGDTITFVEVVDSARVETPGMPGMGDRMAGQAAMMRGQTVTTRMDSRARLLSIEVANANAPDGSGAPAPGGPGAGGAGGQRMPGRNQRPMFVLPERAVRAGDTWTDSVVIAGAGPTEGPTNYLATYKLERIEQRGNFRVAVISMAGNMVSNSPNGPQTMTVTGEIAYDITGRRLVHMTMNMTGTMPTPRGDIPMKMIFTHALVS
jgi:hypothetical protein